MVVNVKENGRLEQAYNDRRERIRMLQAKSYLISTCLAKIEKKQGKGSKVVESRVCTKLSLTMTVQAASLLSLSREECLQNSTAELIEKLRKEKVFSDKMAQQILNEIISVTDNLLQLAMGK